MVTCTLVLNIAEVESSPFKEFESDLWFLEQDLVDLIFVKDLHASQLVPHKCIE